MTAEAGPAKIAAADSPSNAISLLAMTHSLMGQGYLPSPFPTWILPRNRVGRQKCSWPQVSLAQQSDAAVESLEGQREHAGAENFEHDLGGARVAPGALRFGVEPDRVTIGVDQAF